MEAVNYEEIFKDSKPYNIYKELEDEVKDVTDGQHCTEFEGITSTHKEKYVTLCKKVSKLLKYVFDKDKLKKSKEYCSHYKYWVYHEIWKLFKNGQQTDDIHIIDKFNKLQSDLFVKHNKHNCSYGYILNDYEELNYKIEKKYLYDYFKNYNTIKSSKQCSNVGGSKYRAYLEAIKKLYDVEYNSCCLSGLTECPDYILTCDDKFDPSKLLSALVSKGSERCDGLNGITANFDEEKLNSVITDPEFLNSITYGTCYYLDNGEPTPSEMGRQHCNLLAASVMLSRSEPTAGNEGSRTSVSGSSSGNAISESRADQSEGDLSKGHALQGQPDAKEKEEYSGVTEVKKKVAPPTIDASDDFRWKIAATGQLNCSSKNKKKSQLAMCNFMEELIEGGHAKKIEGTEKYTLDIKKGWTTEDLKVYRERIRKRLTYESNILNNIFVRISTGVTLVMGIIFIFYLFFKFTPFGSRLRRHRKRKQRYRLDFTDLSTRKRPRRFLKRTYRHSDRRRFNVVNIEDELNSSNDLRNIN
ncbi:PIR protein [Plasmodium malariae]|uniref:PIR protein n=1 Tax=Plasmodium malariae TaxID=5858 RepID=A0A1D3PB45_PLAMA|nr:PIR protein [Plasmodium malariae]SCN12499.1 PIR protein [Plasmodium malariae]